MSTALFCVSPVEQAVDTATQQTSEKSVTGPAGEEKKERKTAAAPPAQPDPIALKKAQALGAAASEDEKAAETKGDQGPADTPEEKSTEPTQTGEHTRARQPAGGGKLQIAVPSR